VSDPFYRRVIARLVAEGVMRTSESIVVSCAGPMDRDVLVDLGFRHVTITNLDERMTGSDHEPYAWSRQDAEALTYPDGSFDWGLVHHGLHHCASPHKALGELLRVSRRGVVGMEARDSLLVRAGARLGLVEEYEVTAVQANGGRFGGVANGPVPNHVYRWTERELHKTVRSLLPTHDHDVRFFHGLRLPTERLTTGWQRSLAHVAARTGPALETVAPRQMNELAFVIVKNVRPKPWVDVGERA
jgi:SAM-dependent methyltransferase